MVQEAQPEVGVIRQRLDALISQRDAVEAEVAATSARLDAPGQPGLKGSLIDKEGYPRGDIDIIQVRKDRGRLACLTNDHKELTQQIGKLLEQLHEATRRQVGTAAPSALAPAPGSLPLSRPGAPPPPAARTSEVPLPPAPAPAPAPAAADAGATGSTHGEGPTPMDAEPSPSSSSAATAAASASGPALLPFAMVDEVTDASPAAAAGIQAGDLLCAFGDVRPDPSGSGRDQLLQQVAALLQAHQDQPVAATVLRHGVPVQLSLVPRTWAGRGLLGCHLRPL